MPEPTEKSSMYDNPHQPFSPEWKQWNSDAQQKRYDALSSANNTSSWGGLFTPSDQPKPTPSTPAGANAPVPENLSTLDKIVYAITFFVLFGWITEETGSDNWIVGVIGGLIGGYLVARLYKVAIVLAIFYAIFTHMVKG